MRASSTVFGDGARMLRSVMPSERRDRMLVMRVDAVFMSVDSFWVVMLFVVPGKGLGTGFCLCCQSGSPALY